MNSKKKLKKAIILIGFFLLFLLTVVLSYSTYIIFLRETVYQENYQSAQSKLSGLNLDTFGQFGIANLRNFSYGQDKVGEQYSFQVYNISEVESVTYHLAELEPNSPFAHGFITFDMGEQYNIYRHIGVSVEARRENGESYSPWRGLFNQYELQLLWATQEDLLTRRTQLYGTPVESYPLNLSPREQKALLHALVEKTIALEKQAVFYNTLVHNCVSVLAQAVNRIKPGALPWHASFLLTGNSAEYLKSLGYID